MKKLLFTAWLLMLSMVVSAQTFVVRDKKGNVVTYDVSKLDSITFQVDPPAFTVYEDTTAPKSEEPAEPSDPSNPEEPSDPGTPDTPTQEITQFVFEEV